MGICAGRPQSNGKITPPRYGAGNERRECNIMSDEQNKRPHKITYNKRLYNHRLEEEGDYRTVIFYEIIPTVSMLIKHTDYPDIPFIRGKQSWWRRLLSKLIP